MKNITLSLCSFVLLTVCASASAQISPTISVQGTNATLRWASIPGESYVVLYRRAFHYAFDWTVVGTNVPASGGTETLFQHIGGVPRVPAEVGGGGGGGGGTPGTPSAMVAAPSGDPEKEKKDKDKQKDGGFPAFPELPDEKAIEKWLKDMMKEYERMQREGGAGQPVMALMSSSLTAEQATNNSMGFYIVLNSEEDLNNDGVPDGLAAQFGLNPLGDLSLDSDNDGLTDLEEIAHGTDPSKADTDGDGASDAEEVAAGSDPKTPHGLPGVYALLYEEAFDQVNDGTNGGSHFLYRQDWGTRLYESNRVVYATPGSNGEVGYTTVTEWPMHFAQVQPGVRTVWTDYSSSRVVESVETNVAPPLYMRPFDGYWRRGNIDGTRYQTSIQITTHGTNATLKRAYELQLSAFNVTNGTWVAVTNFGGISLGGRILSTNGTCVLLLPENQRTNVTLSIPASMTNLAFYLGMSELTIDIQQVTSDQIAGNSCNSLPTPYFDESVNNPMLMATRTGTDARLQVRLSAHAYFGSDVFVGVRKIGSSAVLGSTRATNDPVTTAVAFTAETGPQTYEVVAGYDANLNATLDANEVISVFRKTPPLDRRNRTVAASLHLLDKLIVVTKADFDREVDFFELGAWGGTAGQLIASFAGHSDQVVDAVRTGGIPISASLPELTHKVGAFWDFWCESTTHRFTFTNGSVLSDRFERSRSLTLAMNAGIATNLDDLLANGSSTATQHTVPLSFSVNFNDGEFEEQGSYDTLQLAKSIGSATILGNVTVEFVKTSSTSISVSRVYATGSFDDLYDFPYNARATGNGGLSRQAAIVQAGHATLRQTPNAGKVFFIRLEYDTGWLNLNKVFSK